MDFREQTWMWRKVCLKQHSENTTNCDIVRTTRARIIYLRNDHKALMNVIEKFLHEHFARQAAIGTSEDNTNETTNRDILSSFSSSTVHPAGPPFAKVNSVVSNSPADTAGLKAGDEIRNFGYVNYTNNDGLKRVGECVLGNEGVSRL
jgi:26S proteasome non-ATPase regulatory subunit 9